MRQHLAQVESGAAQRAQGLRRSGALLRQQSLQRESRDQLPLQRQSRAANSHSGLPSSFRGSGRCFPTVFALTDVSCPRSSHPLFTAARQAGYQQVSRRTGGANLQRGRVCRGGRVRVVARAEVAAAPELLEQLRGVPELAAGRQLIHARRPQHGAQHLHSAGGRVASGWDQDWQPSARRMGHARRMATYRRSGE